MRVGEFIKMEICVDVYDNVCEELGIAFDGPAKLTAEGKREFADVLEYEIDVDEYYGTAVVDIDGPDWKSKLKQAKRFFYGFAGYCSDEDWNRWFKEV